MVVWLASKEVIDIVQEVKEKWHNKRLAEAEIGVSFNDSKPFIGGRFNWGKTSKFSPLAKLWHHKKYDFHISLCADAWLSVLESSQREALVDLHITRCDVDYVPIIIEENGKKMFAKDEWGRIQFTDEIKRDEDGCPKWRVNPLDLNVFQDNVGRYGCWSTDLLEFKDSLIGGQNGRIAEISGSEGFSRGNVVRESVGV